jgi:hypothetical protein
MRQLIFMQAFRCYRCFGAYIHALAVTSTRVACATESGDLAIADFNIV